MREFKFVPNECTNQVIKVEGEADVEVRPSFEGHVTLKVPSITDRIDMMDAIGPAGETQSENLKRAKRLIEQAQPWILSVSLKRVSDGEEFKSYEDLSYDADCDAILSQIGNQLMNGIRPSKK